MCCYNIIYLYCSSISCECVTSVTVSCDLWWCPTLFSSSFTLPWKIRENKRKIKETKIETKSIIFNSDNKPAFHSGHLPCNMPTWQQCNNLDILFSMMEIYQVWFIPGWKSVEWTQKWVDLWNDLGFSLCAAPSVCHMVATSDDGKKSKMEVSADWCVTVEHWRSSSIRVYLC